MYPRVDPERGGVSVHSVALAPVQLVGAVWYAHDEHDVVNARAACSPRPWDVTG